MTLDIAVAPLAIAMTVKLCVPTPSWPELKVTGRLPKKKKSYKGLGNEMCFQAYSATYKLLVVSH